MDVELDGQEGGQEGGNTDGQAGGQQVHDELAIRRVLAEYCRGVDRRDWDLLRSCYHPDAQEDHGIFSGSATEFVTWLAERHAEPTMSMHLLANVLVRLAGDAAFAESYAVTFHGAATEDGHEGLAMGGCRYIDRFERRDGTWRIAARTMTVEFMRPPSATAAVPDVFAPSRRDGGDISYAVLAAVLGG